MINKSTRIVVGIVLVALGVIRFGNYMNIWSLPVFFNGWWTLIIIIPLLADIFSKGIKVMNFTGFAVGLLFLLSETNILNLRQAADLILPLAVALLGVVFIVNH